MSKITWLWTMKKPQVCLAQGLHVISIPLMQKNLGINVDVPIKHVDGDIYFGKEAISDIKREISKKIDKDKKYPDKIKSLVEKCASNINKIKKELENLDIESLSDKELLENFFKGYQIIAEMTAFMSFKGTVQMNDVLQSKFLSMLSKRIVDREKIDDINLLFSMPVKSTFMAMEQNNMLTIATKGEEEREILLEKHRKQFAWMGCIMYSGFPFTKEHYKTELKDTLKKRPKETLAKNKEIKETREAKIRKIAKELNFSSEELNIVRQFRDWAHLRTFIKDMTSVGMEPTIPLLKEIAKRTNVNYKDLLYLNNDELKQIFDDNSLIAKSKKRQKSWGFILINSKPKYYDEDTVHEIQEDEEEIPSGITGFSACKGKVKGRATIVKSVEDLDRLREGDVLITHMTTTDFVPVLSKVVAIVTDEGGITCHAAIISREMNIPCIIGTRLATKAFRNNDTVEVDANKGIVKKL